MTRTFIVDATFKTSKVVTVEDDALTGDDLRDEILMLVDSSTAEMTDWEINEAERAR